MDAWMYQKTLHKRTNDYNTKVAELRRKADEIIVNIWNEVETTYSSMAEDEKRSSSEEYGLVYVFRKSELERNEI
jgi:hypothetical protein